MKRLEKDQIRDEIITLVENEEFGELEAKLPTLLERHEMAIVAEIINNANEVSDQ